MKCVWIINHYAQGGYGVGGSRHYSLARNLLAHGWQCCIIAASVELNTNQQRLGKDEKIRTETSGDIVFRWIATPGYQGNGPGRVFNMLVFTLRLLLPGFRRDLPKPDVIIGSSVHPFAALSAAVLAKKYKVPFIFEVRDLWPLTLIEIGHLRAGGIIARLLVVLEKWLCKKATRIVSVLPKFDEYAASIGIDIKKVVWISNGTDVDMFSGITQTSANNNFTVMYLGAHGNANSLATLLDAMKLIAGRPGCKNIICRLVGSGPLKDQLIQKAEQEKITNVKFEDPVPKSEINVLGEQADIFVLCARDLPGLYRYGISMNKLFDYMAMGRPIIVAMHAVNNPVDESGCGLTVAPENPQVLADAIQALSEMPEATLHAMGEKARDHVEKHYDFKILAGNMAKVLDEVIAN